MRHHLTALRQKWPLGRKLLLFLAVLVVALILPGFGYMVGMEEPARRTLFILSLAIGLWVSEAIPPFATSLLVVAFQVFFLGAGDLVAGDEALIKYTRAWASPVIWLLMGGFFLSLSLTVTGIDREIFDRIARQFIHDSQKFIIGAMLVAAVLSMFVSNTATTALMIGILAPSLAMSTHEGSRRAILVGIPAAASIGGMITIIGSTPNAIAYGYLVDAGIEFGFLSWMLLGFPIAFVLVGVIGVATIKYFKVGRSAFMSERELDAEVKNKSKVSWWHRKIVYATFAVTVGLWLSAPLHNISIAVASLVPIVVLSVSGVIQSSDIRQLPWDTLLLIMGGMSLGESVIESGLAAFLLEYVILDPASVFPILILFAYVSLLMSTFMSNTAAAAILIPLGITLFPEHQLILSLVITFSCCIATALPVSTPPNAVSYASGMVNSRDFAVIGGVLAFLGPPLICFGVWILL